MKIQWIDNLFPNEEITPNLSLLYHKFPYGICMSTQTLKNPRNIGKEYKKDFLSHVSSLSSCIKPDCAVIDRHYTGSGEYTRDLESLTHLLIGLSGSASAVEIDLTLHPYYGFPIIPASSLKGVTFHYYMENEFKKHPELYAIFAGIEDKKHKVIPEGAVVFYDAWPVKLPKEKLLVLDNIATHYPSYYREYFSERKTGNAAKYPRDNENPSLVFFLAVNKGVTFRFAVRPSKYSHDSELCTEALNLIEKALTQYGIGSKTSSNYGYFSKPT